MAQSGASAGAPAILARAHHGSVSKEQRAEIENALKGGLLPAVVATSSLELGIDMGAVDLVVQVESPPSVASGLQRVGRAGHQVGAVSRGVLFPKFRGDLVQTAVVVERMRAGAIESMRIPANPLDVLAQQIVAMCAMDDWSVDDLEALVRRVGAVRRAAAVGARVGARHAGRALPERRVRRAAAAAGVGPRDRRAHRPAAARSGWPSPRAGRSPTAACTACSSPAADGAGRRVGELDEEMVYESRVGDVFTLGTSSWRIEDITHDQVLVTPAPGLPGRLPFWKGDTLGRPVRAGPGGRASSSARWRRCPRPRPGNGWPLAGLDEWATDNLLAYLDEQKQATRHLPSDRTIVVERFRDELGDWRVAVLSPFGAPVHAPWALCVSARMRERFGVDVQAMHGDDGIVFRLPDLEFDGLNEDTDLGGDVGAVPSTGGGGQAGMAELMSLVLLEPDEVHDLVTEQIGGSALFAARFRECAARALLLPRRRPDRRQALWQQRQRSAQLLEVASQYPSFPIVLEAVRECVQDVFDVPGLVDLMTRIRSREVTTVDVETAQPSPFARSLTFGYVAQYIYEGDSPLAERRAAALSLDPTLLAELLGRGDGLSLRDLLDPEAVARTEAELQRLDDSRAAAATPRTSSTCSEPSARSPSTRLVARSEESARRPRRRPLARRPRGLPAGDPRPGRRRGALGRRRGRRHGCATPSACSLPVGVPDAFLEPVPRPARRPRRPVCAHARAVPRRRGRDLVRPGPRRRHRRAAPAGRRGPAGRGRAASRPRPGRRPAASTSATRGCCGPCGGGRSPRCAPRSSRSPRPTSPGSCPAGRASAATLRGTEGLVRAVEQLAGAVVPASALETLVLPARVAGYSPAMLDELMSSGEVLWRGHGSLPGDDGWVSLHVADLAHLTSPPPDAALDLTETHQAVLDALAGGGAYFFRTLSDAIHQQVGGTDDDTLLGALWDLTWAGYLTNDTLAPLRALLARRPHRAPTHAAGTTARSVCVATRRARRASVVLADARPVPGRGGRPVPAAAPGHRPAAGRWSLLPPVESDATVVAYATAEILLERYGVVTRGSAMSESVAGWFRRRLPRAGRGRGVRSGAPRLLRRGAGCGPVRHDRRRRPAPGAEPPARRGATVRRRAPRGGPGRLRPGEPVRRGPHLAGPARGTPRPRGRGAPARDRRRQRPPEPAAASARPGTRVTSRAARRVRSSSSSTASSSSTSSAAASPC